ncbi:MAG: aminopeptidase [Lentisphaeria bacterium]|nr:aminopeptidase [Lentisphaeria bacterium]
MEEFRLAEYARLIVKKGLNLDKGQSVVLSANLEQLDFVRTVIKECYIAGARRVVVNWMDMELDKMAQDFQTEDDLSILMPWETARWQWMTEDFPARLWLDSDDPDGMDGVDQDKYARTLSARLKLIKPFRDKIENKHQWCIAAVPGVKWAEKVFPGLAANEAVEKLWEAILQASRANGDAVANWDRHNENIHKLNSKLNDLHLTALDYKSSNGTDLRIGLIADGVFAGGSERDLSNREFNPNIPSEEIFTSPKRGEAEGWAVSTKPLSYQGTLIDKFAIRFENGKAVEVRAEKGLAALQKMIEMDEGAPYLGECALIAENSPINNCGILFYNTLFDENASCHLALGRGFDICLRDFDKYTQEEIHAKGINESTIHVDFMIGAPDMAIDGVDADGRKIPIFRNGNWVI